MLQYFSRHQEINFAVIIALSILKKYCSQKQHKVIITIWIRDSKHKIFFCF